MTIIVAPGAVRLVKPITVCWPSSTSCYKSPRVFTYLSGEPGSWGPGLWTPRGREFPAPGAALGFTAGNLQVEAPGIPLPDSGECVTEPYCSGNKVEGNDFRREVAVLAE